jgi:plastocyanin
MKAKKRSLIGAAAVGAVAVSLTMGLSACGSSSSSTTSGGSSSSTAAGSGAQTAALQIMGSAMAAKNGILGPDKAGHDTYVPSKLTVKAGVPVTITVKNYDEGPHSFTVTSLGINETISGHVSATQPSTTTFTVTFPTAGTYRWYCAIPCDAKHGGWAMTPDSKGHGPSQDGFMAGYVTAA